ncbi:MAG: sigma-54 dependent transcriptional regulator [Puniceicoccales bacterium]|nr:sigma-54 dependent transcriptional regulator [Puniceicoccales bacterium]
MRNNPSPLCTDMRKLLLVDGEKKTQELLKAAFQDSWDIYSATCLEEAEFWLHKESIDVVLSELCLRQAHDGLKLLELLHRLSPEPTCVLMSARGDVETVVKAMKRGAFDFLSKPLNLENLRIVLLQAVEGKRSRKSSIPEEEKPVILLPENPLRHQTRSPASRQGNLLCAPDSPLVSLQQKATQVARTQASILLQGETGTGKEVFAHWIHYNSPRASGPMVTVHCAALSETLLESELFGHERGAFTGAMNRHVGYFERAHGGTIFLDEIGEINLQTQVKLLRFIETLQIERVGSTEPLSLDVRLITATHRSLEAMIREGSFREDLYYRLHVVKLSLPALRERPMDIPLLLDFYLQKACFENGIGRQLHFSSDAIDALQHYFWPGNIRELRHTCESAAILLPEHRYIIERGDLDPKFLGQLPDRSPHPPELVPLARSIYLEDHQERLNPQCLQKALEESRGNKTLAAQRLGISRRTLYRKIQALSSERQQF